MFHIWKDDVENIYQTSGRCRDPVGHVWEVARARVKTQNYTVGE